MSSFSKSSVFKMFSEFENAYFAFSNCSALKSIFEKLCFRGGLVYAVALTPEMKVRFQISLAKGWFSLATESESEA